MHDQQTHSGGGDDRRVPDSVLIAWLVALAVLVVLSVNVVRHLAAGPSDHMSHSRVLFRGDDPGIDGPLLSHRLFTAWQVNAVAIAALALAAAWYLTRVAVLRRRHGTRWRIDYTLAFLAGLAVCAYATCGAIAVYDQALFTAHMLGHLALVMLAPALIVAGRPLGLAAAAGGAPTVGPGASASTAAAGGPATERRIRRVTHSAPVALLTSPPVALACYTAVIVGSHLTGLMDTIMRVTWVGQVEHVVYLLVGYQFFSLIVGDEPIKWRLSTPARWVLLAVAMAVDTFTGVILMMATRAIDMGAPSVLQTNALSDTHTGGAIMWFGGDAIMAVIMIALVIGWLKTSGRSERDSTSWLEQAREATLGDHAKAAPHTGPSPQLDDDDDRLAAYNSWLAKIAGTDSSETPDH